MQQAGTAIMAVYRTQFHVEAKQDASPITEADRRSHEIILHGLGELGGISTEETIPVLSEEGRDIPYSERKEWGCYWLVDPLDGTKEFVKRNGEFTVNIALVCQRRPVLGVVYVPVQDTIYYGIRGVGSRRLKGLKNIDPDGIGKSEGWEDLAGPRDSRIGPLRIIGSRSHHSVEFDEYVKKMEEEFGETAQVLAGSSLKFCRVAEGSADVYPRFGPTMEWDTAAGHAVAVGAGRNVLDCMTDEELLYNKENLRNGSFICR
jgi:3'(2'), 5'-bisphosphate nucleotidase